MTATVETITEATITGILDRAGVPAEFHNDPELCAAAYGLAFLDTPASPAEERLYTSHTILEGDTPGEGSYTVGTRVLLEEVLHSRIGARLDDLDEDLYADGATA